MDLHIAVPTARQSADRLLGVHCEKDTHERGEAYRRNPAFSAPLLFTDGPAKKPSQFVSISKALTQVTDFTKGTQAILHKNRNGMVLRLSDQVRLRIQTDVASLVPEAKIVNESAM